MRSLDAVNNARYLRILSVLLLPLCMCPVNRMAGVRKAYIERGLMRTLRGKSDSH